MVTFQLFNEKSKYTLFEFEFLQTLGSGSFANVKLVKEKKTGKLFALKMVRITNSKTTNAEIYNIKCEIFIHRKLDHPNIIKFHDYIQYDSGVYLVLDYTENGNLYTYLHRKKTLTDKEIFRFFYQTCLAVQYLHQNDVLHRDIKPENLLLDKDLNVKLCDFGWATQRIQDKRLTFCGTYEYMAPEIAYKRPYDYKVDIWSLGILLYELIHGQPPYKGRSLPEIYKSFTRGLVKFNVNCHPEAKDLIQKILKQNPNDRLSLSQILAHPWVRYNLSKEENIAPVPNIPQQKILFHSHSLPPETTIEPVATERNSKDYCEPRTATHAQTKLPQYDNWAEYLKGNQTEPETARPYLDCSQNGKDNEKNNMTAPEIRDENVKRVLYSSSSNKDLHNIPLKPVENSYILPEPVKRRSPSPKSATPIINAQTPNLVRTPEKSCENKNKIFVNNIFSPSFKSKLTNVIRQLTVQTPSNQENTGFNSTTSSKNVLQQINQNTPMNQGNQASSPLAKAFSIQVEKENQKIYYGTIKESKEEYSQPTSPHFDLFFQNPPQSKNEIPSQNTKDDTMKLNFTEQVYHYSSKDYPPSSSATTRTNTLDLSHGNEIRSPFERSSKEATEQYRYFPENFKENSKTSPALRPNKDVEERSQQQVPANKKAIKIKGILESGVVRYQIPITLPNTTQNRTKQNFL